jgi:1-acyl-sn-glycerol-3-phosphate acyltransferase
LAQPSETIRVPRRRFVRGILRLIGRFVVWLLANIKLTGHKNFPKQGPLIIIANHVDNADGLLLGLHVPYLAEAMVAADLSFGWFIERILKSYGAIPVYRGKADGTATRQALSVLEQGGVVLLFPEGGIWRPAGKPLHTGAAWLSQKAQAPVLPVGLVNTRGAFKRALKFERPEVEIRVGTPLPPPSPAVDGKPDKAQLQMLVEGMMAEVAKLVPPDSMQQVLSPDEYQFDLKIALTTADGQPLALPKELPEAQAKLLGELYYDMNLLDTFKENVRLPVDARPLLEPNQPYAAAAVAQAIQAMLHYVDTENVYFFSYRYGQKDGDTIRAGFEFLQEMAQQAADKKYQLMLHPKVKRLKSEKMAMPS